MIPCLGSKDHALGDEELPEVAEHRGGGRIVCRASRRERRRKPRRRPWVIDIRAVVVAVAGRRGLRGRVHGESGFPIDQGCPPVVLRDRRWKGVDFNTRGKKRLIGAMLLALFH